MSPVLRWINLLLLPWAAAQGLAGCAGLAPLTPVSAALAPSPIAAVAPASAGAPPASTGEARDATPQAPPIEPAADRVAELPGDAAGPRLPEPASAEPPLRSIGTASWYGIPFHGRRTSSGERYDMNALTAAHPTLPLRSYVRVRHLGNGREVVLRVNDRGPFHGGRIIDLSRAAARALRITGVALVEVLRVTDEEIRAALAGKRPPSNVQ